MVNFEFSRRDSSAPHGFDLGDMAIRTDAMEVNSQNKKPDQGMMIYLTIIALLDGLRALMTRPQREFELIGTDSSFSVRFSKDSKTQWIRISSRGHLLGEASTREIQEAVSFAVSNFLSEHTLSDEDPVKDDLMTALTQWSSALSNK